MSIESHADYLILIVEESVSRLGFYDPVTHHEVGHVNLSLWPHEIAVSDDGLAYVSNFGVRDYDLTLGHAGNSVSVVDIASRCEVRRLITRTDSAQYWAPHGVKLSADQQHVYVNVERVVGERGPDLDRPGSEYTKLLKFDRKSGQCLAAIEIPEATFDAKRSRQSKFTDGTVAYDVLPGTHNFVFSPHDPNELWLFSGRSGVSVMEVDTGKIVHRMQEFNGAVRSLSFGTKTGNLLVSATNEVSIVDPKTRVVLKRIGNLGVGQLLYSKLTPDERHILAPAVWEGQLLVINVETGQVEHRLSTGIDPVQVVIAPDKQRAYITHGRSRWLAYVELDRLDCISGRIHTRGGPNGTAFAAWSPEPAQQVLTLAAALPFTGRYSVEGRELRLGYQYWKDTVNDSGGLLVDGVPHRVDIAYADTGSSIDEEKVSTIATKLLSDSSPLAMLGSYPSKADVWIAHKATERLVPFVTGLGTDPSMHQTHVFSLAAAPTCTLAGVLQAVKRGVSPKPVSVAVLASDEAIYLDEAIATAVYAEALGFTLVSPNGTPNDHVIRHTPGEVRSSIQAIQGVAPDFLLVVSDTSNSIAVIRACNDEHFRPGGIGLAAGVSNASFKGKLGALGDGLLGGVQWSDAIFHYSDDRFGCGEDYARGYFDRYSEPVSLFGAGGSAAAIAIERAIQGGCTNKNDLTKSLQDLEFSSFFGDVKFDEVGRNISKKHYAVQLKWVNGELVDVPLWPVETAKGRRPRWPLAPVHEP